MDRRQKKTREAIFNAFSRLIEEKRYGTITVQEIIDGANVGRSTFYSHFETKDELLKVMCNDIFNHVFSEELTPETTHDFSGSGHDLESKLTHILYHLMYSHMNISGILASDSQELFMKYFKEYLADLFNDCIVIKRAQAPEEFVRNHLVGSFSETVIWWMGNGVQYKPEEIAGYFMEVSGLKEPKS